jgi:hypothetical protein
MHQKNEKIKKFGEVFTPQKIISNLLEGIDYENPNLKFCEPSFGDGRILLALKNELLKFHTEQHIIENMLYGVEIQKDLYDYTVQLIGADKYKNNLYCGSALNLEKEDCPISSWAGKIDFVIGNPPYNRNILKKSEVTEEFWNPSGYTTKLAYCCFVVMGNFLLKENAELRYVMPCSFTHNENTEQFREYLRNNLKINSIDVLEKNAFDGVMIRTCIFKSTKAKENNVIHLSRIWDNKKYQTETYFNEYNEIPLFIGEQSKSIYEKVVQNKKVFTAYKGWNGVDSYAKYSSKDENEYEHKYVDKVTKTKIKLKSTMFKDKTKAKKNKKKNNIGNYNRFNLKKIMINEILYDSFEAKKHVNYIVKDTQGLYGASPLQTVIVFNDDTELESFIGDLSCSAAQMMFSVMKDYNHNDSKLFRYIPSGISKIILTKEEEQFLSNFSSLDKKNILSLS